MSVRTYYPEFGEGPAEGRSSLFWAWNGRLEKSELSRQIHEFKKAGFRGFFMHSRDGLETPYLGDEWDGCVKHCTEEADKLEMQAWLYDEDRWPSGSCGGKISSLEGGKYALKGLTLEVLTEKTWQSSNETPDFRAAYAAEIEGHDIRACRRLPRGQNGILEPEETLLIVRFETSCGSEWFNGSPPPDNLNYDTVRKFMESTHKHYESYLKPYFGNTVPGIFTDEPSLADRHAHFPATRGWIPWSFGMEEFYHSLGYGDIYDRLPYFYFHGSESTQIRFRYWRCLALRFEKAYSQQIGAWCREAGIKFSGHYLQEDKTGLATRVNGSVMPHYTHEDIPGVDLLTEKTDEYLTVKQCSSIVNQYGKEGLIAETYAATGWDFSLEGMKWIGDWEYALGVTQRCLHLSLYCLKGERKRDYPPSFLDHNPIWPLMKPLEDYFSRLSYILRQGEVIRNVLVIHPSGSVWTEMGCSPYGNPIRSEERDVARLDDVGYGLNDTLAYLCRRGRDCDLGDETLLARDGRAEGGRLRLGRSEYSIVVLPELKSLYGSTLKILREFVHQGGSLVIMGSPHLIEGERSEDLDDFLRSVKLIHCSSRESLLNKLNSLDPPLFSLFTPDGSLSSSFVTQLRADGDRLILFMANNERDKAVETELCFHGSGTLHEADLLSGEFREVPSTATEEGHVSLSLEVEGCGSRLFIIDQSSRAALPFERIPCREITADPLLRGEDAIPVKVHSPNQLVLDYARYALGDSRKEEGEGFIWLVNRDVRNKLSMRQVDGGEVIQRYLWVDEPHRNNGTPLRLYFSFAVDSIPEGDVWLSLEEAREFSIKINGVPLTGEPVRSSLFRDQEMYLLSDLKTGHNELELSCLFREDITLDSVYILGDFGISEERTIMAPPEKLSYGDWTKQGLFHYAGCVSYYYEKDVAKDVTSVSLVPGKWEGLGMEIICNGENYSVLWKGQKEIDISKSIKTGECNRFEIKIYGSQRNLLGPLHKEEEAGSFINPQFFLPEKDQLSMKYLTRPYGLFDEPILRIRE